MNHLRNAVLIAGLGLFAGTGCLGLQLGGGSRTEIQGSTAGQQLLDLKRAKDSGALSEAEYNQQRDKVLNGK